MKLIPRHPQQYVNLKDPVLGEIEIYREGKPFLYQQGVYLLSKHQDILDYEFEGNEVPGPAPLVPPSSPSDVVIPDSMRTDKGPEAPVAKKAKAAHVPPAGGDTPPTPPADA